MRNISLSDAGLLFPTVATLATCVNEEGKANIVALGWAMKTSHDPPMVAISVKPSRYSHNLIQGSGEFVLVIPTMDLVETFHFCGRNSGKDTDKFMETEFTPIPASRVRPPLIKECVENLECKVVVSKTITGDHTIFVGEIVAAHVDEDAFNENKGCLDSDKAIAIVTKSDEYRVVGDVAAYKLNGGVKVL
jgi:flavin reductase (DIM6/NTAB) family NADH-FMN oxidoreductase RutF